MFNIQVIKRNRNFLDPRTISGCVLWLRASDILGVDGSTVTSWADQSEAGNTLTATNGTTTLKTGILNGYPVARFSSSIMSANAAVLSSKTSLSVFFVYTPRSSPVNVLIEQSDSNLSFENSGNVNGLFYVGSSGGAAATAAVVGVFEIRSLIANGSTLTNYKNGVGGSAVAFAGNTSTNPFRLGGRVAGSLYSPSDVAEVIVYDRDIGAAAQSLVQEYLSRKYGITI
jgi:hypothetical protein